MRRIFLLASCLLLLSGCFETDFNFKTVVKPNGSIIRETKMTGRGANRFVVPSGKSWQVKTYETRSGQSLLQDTIYNVYAIGRFDSDQGIGSDYRFDVEKQFANVSDEERRNFIQLGITEPFSESVYSKNFVQIVKHQGLFRSTFEYQEIFQNKGVIELLLNDVKKEIVRERAVPMPEGEMASFKAETVEAAGDGEAESAVAEAATRQGLPAVTVEGSFLAPQVLDRLARERMASDVLKQFNFRSEVSLPGKLISSNAETMVNGTAVWEFSLADFAPDYSHYTLKARSQMIEWKTIVLMAVILLVGILGLSFVKVKPTKKRSRGNRENRESR